MCKLFLPENLEYTIPENVFMLEWSSNLLKCSGFRLLASTISAYFLVLHFLPISAMFEKYDKSASFRCLFTRWRLNPQTCSTKFFWKNIDLQRHTWWWIISVLYVFLWRLRTNPPALNYYHEDSLSEVFVWLPFENLIWCLHITP